MAPIVMAGLGPAIHVLRAIDKVVDARAKPAHDGKYEQSHQRNFVAMSVEDSTPILS
jgi:hypothetical protein